MLGLSKLKICYIAGTLGQGGAERQLFYAVQALRQNGAAVRVLSLDSGGFWEAPISQLGATVTHVGQAGSRVKRVCRILKVLKKRTRRYSPIPAFLHQCLCECLGVFSNCKAIWRDAQQRFLI